MSGPSGVEPALLTLICCPKCGGDLEERERALHCAQCLETWPVDRGVPLLVNEAKVPKAKAGRPRHKRRR